MSAVESSMTTEDSEKWTRLPDDKSIVRTVNALQSRGITAESVSTREDALKLLAKRIPPGAEVMTGASATLDEIGFLQLLKLGTHQWKNLKSEITGEKERSRQTTGASSSGGRSSILRWKCACGRRDRGDRRC